MPHGHRSGALGRAADAGGPVRDDVLHNDVCYQAEQYVGPMHSQDDPKLP